MNQSHKLASFEGLRGIAAFIVLLSHLRLTFWVTSSEDIWHSLSSLPHVFSRPLLAIIEGFYNGTFAVWLFWIMSAFVLSLQFFLRARHSSLEKAHEYLEDAFLRRYPRLLIPVFASVIFAYALHAAHLMQNVTVAHMLGEPYASGWLASWYKFPASFVEALKCAVWQSFFAYNQSSTYNNVLWTMEKEFYGSLFLFAFLSLFGHRRSRVLFYFLLILINRLLNQSWLSAFTCGIALCDLFVNHGQFPIIKSVWHQSFIKCLRERHVQAVLWIAMIAGAGLPDFRGVFYLFLGASAVVLTVTSTFIQRILSHPLPLFLGRISFGLYLIHVPLICSFSCWVYLLTVTGFGHAMAAIFSSFLTCLLSVACGYLLFVLADRPSIRISRLFSSCVMNVFGRAPQLQNKGKDI